MNKHILAFFRKALPEIMLAPGNEDAAAESSGLDGVGEMTHTSTFGEAEVGDITAW